MTFISMVTVYLEKEFERSVILEEHIPQERFLPGPKNKVVN